jgi:hypothetical protein
MKPNRMIPSNAVSTPLAALSTAKIIRHPDSKKIKKTPLVAPPDEETLMRLNAMAKQYPFCIQHRGKNGRLL